MLQARTSSLPTVKKEISPRRRYDLRMTLSMADSLILNSSRNSVASSEDIWASSCSSLPLITRQSSVSVILLTAGRRSSSSSLLKRTSIGFADKNAKPLNRGAAASSAILRKGVSFSRFCRHSDSKVCSWGSIFLPRV